MGRWGKMRQPMTNYGKCVKMCQNVLFCENPVCRDPVWKPVRLVTSYGHPAQKLEACRLGIATSWQTFASGPPAGDVLPPPKRTIQET